MENRESIPGQEFQEQPKPNNLLDNQEATLESMAKVEGEGWLQDQQQSLQKPEKAHIVTVGGAINMWRSPIEEMREVKADQTLSQDEKERKIAKLNDFPTVIYGRGGGNRWYLRPDGSIYFDWHYKCVTGEYPTEAELIKGLEDSGIEIVGLPSKWREEILEKAKRIKR